MRDCVLLLMAIAATFALAACEAPANDATADHPVATLPTPTQTATPTPFDRFLHVYLPSEQNCLFEKVGRDHLLAAVEEASRLSPTAWHQTHWEFGYSLSPCIVPPEHSSSVFDQGVGRFRIGTLDESPAPGGLGRVAIPGSVEETRLIFQKMPELVNGDTKEELLDIRGGILSYGESFVSFGYIPLAAVPYRQHWAVADVLGNELRSTNRWEEATAGRDGDLVWLRHLISGNQVQVLFGDAEGRMIFDFRANNRDDLDALVESFVDFAVPRSRAGPPTPADTTIRRPPPGPPTSTSYPVQGQPGTPGR